MKKTPAARLDRDIAEALAKEASKAKLMAEFHALKRALKDPTLTKTDEQDLRSKLAVIDNALVALCTAEYKEFLSKPRKGGY